MSRSKVGVASEGKVPAPKEGAAEAADSARDLVSMMETMMKYMEQTINERMTKVINQMDNVLQASEQKYSSGLGGV